MKTTPNESLPSLTPHQLVAEGAALGNEIIEKVLRPRESPVRTVVVLEALVLLYRFHAQSLPADAQRSCAMALASAAGDLLSASTFQTAPQGVPVH